MGGSNGQRKWEGLEEWLAFWMEEVKEGACEEDD